MKDHKNLREYLTIIIAAVLVIALIGLFAYQRSSNSSQKKQMNELTQMLESEQQARTDLEQKLQEESEAAAAQDASLESELQAESEEIARVESEGKERNESEQKAREDLESQVQSQLEDRQQKESEDAEAALTADQDSSNFYQKLSKGYECRILVLGDETSYGSGSSDQDHVWTNALRSYLRVTYGSDVSVKNLSLPEATSYTGYARLAEEEDGSYDAVILCFGKNDEEDDFSVYYEALIRAIGDRWPDCAVLSVIEPEKENYYAKNGYSQNAGTILEICDHYEIPVIDCVQTFTRDYDALTDKNGNPNNDGQEVFAQSIETAIDKMTASGRTLPDYVAVAINEEAAYFDQTCYLAADSFERVDDVTYSITGLGDRIGSISNAVVGIDYSCISGSNRITVTVDGGKGANLAQQYRGSSPQRRITVVRYDCSVEDEIEVVFADSDCADTFNGILLNW